MIFASLDLNRKNLEQFMNSLNDIKRSKFDGVEICLWEDMREYAKQIKKKLILNKLKSNIHNDLMREKEGFKNNLEKIRHCIEFSNIIGAESFITHPIKPYLINLKNSKKLFDSLDEQVLVENVEGIKQKELQMFNKGIVLDIGNLTKNGDLNKLKDYRNIKWIHIHDFANGKDHLPIGSGQLDFDYLIDFFQDKNYTIELGNTFRTWPELKKDYRKSIDFIRNLLIKQKSYGKNVRLTHLKQLINCKRFNKSIEFGCKEAYLLHNIDSIKKIAYDLKPIPTFNDINYIKKDVKKTIIKNSDIIICSEVIEHITNPLLVIKNIYHSLVKGGYVFLTTINKNTPTNKSKKDKLHGHFRRYGPELKKIMESVRFTTLEFYPIRGKHYYDFKDDFSKYDYIKDKEDSINHASGWVYFGKK